MNAGTPKALAARSRAAPYAKEFRAAIGRPRIPRRSCMASGVAIEAFLKSDEMTPARSKYDAYVRGQATLTEPERRGLEAFKDRRRGACVGCHRMAETSSTPRSRRSPTTATTRSRCRGTASCRPTGSCGLRPWVVPAEGAGEAPSSDERFCGGFRTPSLRNVAARSSFGHNGVYKTLREVVAFYARRAVAPDRIYPPGQSSTTCRRSTAATSTFSPRSTAGGRARRPPLRRRHRRDCGFSGNADRCARGRRTRIDVRPDDDVRRPSAPRRHDPLGGRDRARGRSPPSAAPSPTRSVSRAANTASTATSSTAISGWPIGSWRACCRRSTRTTTDRLTPRSWRPDATRSCAPSPRASPCRPTARPARDRSTGPGCPRRTTARSSRCVTPAPRRPLASRWRCRCSTASPRGTATWPASSARANPRWLSSIGPTPPGRWAARARRPAPAGSPGRC